MKKKSKSAEVMYSKGFDNYKNINILVFLKLYAVNIFTMMRSKKENKWNK